MDYFDGSVTQTTYYPLYNEANQLKNRNVGSNQYTYDYDTNGNMTWEKLGQNNLRKFVWNADNRLNEVVNYGGGHVFYAYDALGRRIARNDYNEAINTLYFYDGLTVIAEKEKVEADGTWDWQRIFTVAPGVIGNIFRISEKSGANWVDTYYHYDAIGNVALRTNSSGGVVESIDQEAYGNVKTGSQSGYHLTTKEYDSIPELYYFWQRWYDPIISIFISISPYSANVEQPYCYTNNNPMKYFDPSGEYALACRDTTITSRLPDQHKCASLVGVYVDDPTLAACIENKINDKDTKITCRSTGFCNHPDRKAHPTVIGINLCPGKFQSCLSLDMCLIIIHELAHTCGWSDKQGRPGSVPGWDGSYTCNNNRCP